MPGVGARSLPAGPPSVQNQVEAPARSGAPV